MATKAIDKRLSLLEARRAPIMAYPPGRDFWDPARGAWSSNGDMLCTFGLAGMRLCYDLAMTGDEVGFAQLLSLAAAENGHPLDGPRLAWAIEASKRAAAITCNDPWWNAAATLNDAQVLRDWLEASRESN